MTAPELSPAELAIVTFHFEKAEPAPESWHLRRCGVRDCSRFGTRRVDVAEAWYLMCDAHATEYAEAGVE